MSTLSYRRFVCKQANALHLVLIHGWGLPSGVWNKVIEPLSAFAHVTVIDRAGYGNSPMMTATEEQQAILDITPPCAIYIGWSLGGTLVLDMANRYPNRVMAVVTVATNPCFVQRDDWWCAMPAEVFDDFQQRVMDNAYLGLVRFIGLQCQGSATQREDMRFLQEQLAAQQMPHSRVLLSDLSKLLQSDCRVLLQKLSCPVLWIKGAKDSLVQVDADTLFVLNPLIAVSITSKAAHAPFVSHPELFVKTIKNFLHELQNDCF